MEAVSIYAPYRHSEITEAALRLADFAFAQGFLVRLLSPGLLVPGLHSHWDRHVRTARSSANILNWARPADYFVWFEPDPVQLDLARLINEARATHSPPAKHTLVVPWQDVSAEAEVYVQFWDYDWFVSPSSHIGEAVTRELCLDDNRVSRWVDWGPPLPPVRRVLRSDDEQLALLVLADLRTLRQQGDELLRVVSALLELQPRLRLTLCCERSWNRSQRRRLRDLLGRFPDRLSQRQRVSLSEKSNLLHGHDWVWLPSAASNFGQDAWHALSCGTPVICYDMPPLSEIVFDGVNGVRLECELTWNWLGAIRALPDFSDVVSQLMDVLNNRELLTRLQRQRWNLKDSQDSFQQFWLREWELSTLERTT
jgi:glycosyltransferase involved in cell wall biosynthesis